jgi:tyrosyl-DNA phosphodiesterase 2
MIRPRVSLWITYRKTLDIPSSSIVKSRKFSSLTCGSFGFERNLHIPTVNMTHPPSAIMQALTAAMSSGPAKQLEDTNYKPRKQDYWHAVTDGTWQPISPPQLPSSAIPEPAIDTEAIRLISWNIDVLVGYAEERMRAALQYLDRLIALTPNEVPVVVFLQEMGQSDLEQIRDAVWIKQRFNIAEIDHLHWLSPYYGTNVLVDRRLAIKNIFRVPWVSKFDRDGLFVDIALTNTQDPHGNPKLLRLCNVHLESLVANPPVRPSQMALASQYLKKPEVAASLVAGDMNAIQPFDRTLYSENGLRDAYLELGGQEDSDDGYTWGYQVPQWLRDKFGCSRMDKILLRGALQPRKFERIGMGVKVDEAVRQEVETEVEGGWVTDHYGVMGDFALTEGWSLHVLEPGVDSKAKSKLT